MLGLQLSLLELLRLVSLQGLLVLTSHHRVGRRRLGRLRCG